MGWPELVHFQIFVSAPCLVVKMILLSLLARVVKRLEAEPVFLLMDSAETPGILVACFHLQLPKIPRVAASRLAKFGV